MSTGTKPFQVVRHCDPAIVPESAEEFRRYLETRDFSILKFPTTKPEVFWCRLLTPSEEREVANKTTERDQYEAAFARGVVRVEALSREDGSRSDWTRPSDAAGRDLPIPEADLYALFDEATRQEIGMVVRQKSFLRRTKGHYFPLPGISRSALLATLGLRAEPTPASSPSAATKSEAREQPAIPPTSSPPGDASTDATATG